MQLGYGLILATQFSHRTSKTDGLPISSLRTEPSTPLTRCLLWPCAARLRRRIIPKQPRQIRRCFSTTASFRNSSRVDSLKSFTATSKETD
jgi:hypothetical protein